MNINVLDTLKKKKKKKINPKQNKEQNTDTKEGGSFRGQHNVKNQISDH